MEWPWRAVGIVLVVLAAAVTVWVEKLFKQRDTTVEPLEKPSALIDYGPFRLSRHPMYLGMFTVLLGVGVVSGSLISFVGPVLFLTLMEALFIPREESSMEETFGAEYAQYRGRVGRPLQGYRRLEPPSLATHRWR